jgi:hypothetical protein
MHERAVEDERRGVAGRRVPWNGSFDTQKGHAFTSPAAALAGRCLEIRQDVSEGHAGELAPLPPLPPRRDAAASPRRHGPLRSSYRQWQRYVLPRAGRRSPNLHARVASLGGALKGALGSGGTSVLEERRVRGRGCAGARSLSGSSGLAGRGRFGCVSPRSRCHALADTALPILTAAAAELSEVDEQLLASLGRRTPLRHAVPPLPSLRAPHRASQRSCRCRAGWRAVRCWSLC